MTTTAMLALALGIGVNTAIFSLLDGVLPLPLPFPEPERLVLVWEETSILGLRDSPASMGNFMEWRARNRLFQDMGTLDNSSYQIDRRRHARASQWRDHQPHRIC